MLSVTLVCLDECLFAGGSSRKKRISHKRGLFCRLLKRLVLFSLVLLSVSILVDSKALAQIKIRERITILPHTTPLPSLVTPSSVQTVTSGFVVPRGLRNQLQVWYTSLTRLNEAVPAWAKLMTFKRDSTGRDTSFFDAVSPRLPRLSIMPETFDDYCGGWYQTADMYSYDPTSTGGVDTITRVTIHDTITLGYLTQKVGVGNADTLWIASADTQKVWEGSSVDSVVAGWNVTFQDPNACLQTWNEKLDIFIALDCPKYIREFGQGDSPWADSAYLYYTYNDTNQTTGEITVLPYTIARKGCALTAMTLVAKALGLQADPGSLNWFKKRNHLFYGNDSSMVDWHAIEYYPSMTNSNPVVAYDTTIGVGIYKNQKTRKLTGVPLSLSLLDTYLNRCRPIIAQVSNPAGSFKNHWVIIAGKSIDGSYDIIDPGSASRTKLSFYENTVYKFVTYKSKSF